jgi:hypothetical protein
VIAPDTAMIGRFGQRRRSDRRIEARCFDRLLPGATAFNRHHFISSTSWMVARTG